MRKHSVSAIVFVCLMLIFGSSFSQEDPGMKPIQLNAPYLLSYPRISYNLVLSPVKWNAKQWIGFGSVIGVSAGLVAYADQPMKDWTQSNRTNTSDAIASYGLKHFGDGLYSMPVLGVLYAYGTYYHNERPKETALMALQSFVIAGTTATIFKEIAHRERPNETLHPDVWNGPSFSSRHLSFPSGHTTAAFAVASVLASEYHEKPLVVICAYTLASLTGISRIHDNRHWASDVFAGACLGTAVGRFVWKFHRRSEKKSPYT